MICMINFYDPYRFFNHEQYSCRKHYKTLKNSMLIAILTYEYNQKKRRVYV